jgi:hypothetical protein
LARARESGGRADETAAGFAGDTTITAKRAVFWLVAFDGKTDEGLGFNGKLDLPAAAVNQSASGDDASTGLFNDLDGFLGRAAGGPDVFDHENVLIGPQIKTAAQRHDAAGIALDKKRRDAATVATLWLGQGASYFLADDYAAEGWRNHSLDVSIGEEGSEGAAELFCVAGILEHQGALDVSAAVQTAGELEVAVANSTNGFEEFEQFLG